MPVCCKRRMWKERVVVHVRKTRTAVNREALSSGMTRVTGKRRTMAVRAELETLQSSSQVGMALAQLG